MTEPNGCAVCGKGQRSHAIEWHPAVGFHTWQEPTDAQRLERMKKTLDNPPPTTSGACSWDTCTNSTTTFVTGPYTSAVDFHYQTDYRFGLDFSEPIPFPLNHDHRWAFTGTPREFECVKDNCDAVKRGA